MNKIAVWWPLFSIVGSLAGIVGTFVFVWYIAITGIHPAARVPLLAAWLLLVGDVFSKLADDMQHKKWPFSATTEEATQ